MTRSQYPLATAYASQHIPANCETYGSGLQRNREALDRTGEVTASRLYAPYGASRCSSGSFPTSVGYTGQREDSATGLYYYGARYYDPALAQFTSADTAMDGLNRYGYVGGNPTSATDPSGHRTALTDAEVPADEVGEVNSPWPDIIDYGASSGGRLGGRGGKILYTLAVAAATLYFVKGSMVSVDDNGNLIVTTHGKGYATSVTQYSPGDKEWIVWSHLIDAQYADDAPWNARTAPKSTLGIAAAAAVAHRRRRPAVAASELLRAEVCRPLPVPHILRTMAASVEVASITRKRTNALLEAVLQKHMIFPGSSTVTSKGER